MSRKYDGIKYSENIVPLAEQIEELQADKVDKVEGKQLTEENFTTEYKEYLQSIIDEDGTLDIDIEVDETKTVDVRAYQNVNITVTHPETLIPENVREGIVIGNVTGVVHEGITPTGTLTITENGTYDITNYASVVIAIPAPTLQTKVVTPLTTTQTITPDDGYDGLSQVDISAVTSSIDENIIANNIKDGITILGINGTYTNDATATSNDILLDKIAYANGEKLIGTITTFNEGTDVAQ